MYQNQQLPVSPEYVQGPMFQGLPWNLPFQLQLPLPPQQQELAAYAAGHLLQELQEQAGKNPLRMFLFNLNAVNNYQNQEFNELLVTVVEYSEFLMATQRQSPEQAVLHAVKEVCSIMASVNTQKYPALQQYIPDRQTYEDIQRWLTRFQEIVRDVEQFQRASQPTFPSHGGFPQQSYAQGYPQQSRGWGTPPGNFRQPPLAQQRALTASQRPYGGPGSMAMPTQPQVPTQHHSGVLGGQSFARQGYGQPQYPQSTVTGNTRYGGTLKARAQTTPQEPTSFTAGPNQDTRFEYEPTTRPQVNHDQITWANETPSRDNQTTKGGEEVEMGKYDDFIAEDGSHWRPAFKSGWTKSPSEEQLYTPAYDPRREILFHRRAQDGTVTEVLVEVSDENQYLTYELNPAFARKVSIERESDPTQANWEEVGNLPSADEIAAEREARMKALKESGAEYDEDVEALQEPSLVVPTLVASSLYEASLGGHLEVIRAGEDVSGDLPVEYFYYQATPLLAEENLISTLQGLYNTTTFGGAVEALKQLKGEIPDRIWYTIHDRMTEHVNEILQDNMQLSVRISSFVDGVEDLVSNIEEYDGEVFSKIFASKANLVIKANVRVLKGDLLRDYLAKMDFQIEDPSIIEDILVLGQLNSVTEVPWLSSDLPLSFEGSSGAVLESRFPNLHSAIRKIFERTARQKGKTFRHHYILTKDNVKIKVFQGFVGKGFYLIGKA